MTEEGKRTKAWIGDAVLALFAREWILKQTDISTKERAEVFIQINAAKAKLTQSLQNASIQRAFFLPARRVRTQHIRCKLGSSF